MMAVFDGGTIYLLLLEEFLETDILGVVKEVIFVSTFFGEGIPAMRFSLALLAASTISAVSDFLLTTCSEFSSLSLMSDLAITRDCSEVVSIGGRLTEEWFFFKVLLGELTFLDGSFLTSGGRSMGGVLRLRSRRSGAWVGWSKLGK